jgi:HAD superfamily hydrolase (TIGR01549 family)
LKPIPADVVAFDFGNTLLLDPFDETLGRIGDEVRSALTLHGCDASESDLFVAWTQANREVNFQYASHFMQEEPIVQEALKRLGMPSQERALAAPEVLRVYREAFKSVLEELPMEETRAMLRDLKGRGKGLVVLSNDREFATPTMLRWMGLFDCFDLVLTSEEMGLEKPDPRIFEVLSQRLRCAKQRIVYVGDDPLRDVSAGKSAGLSVILYAPPQMKHYSAPWRDYSLSPEHQPDAVIQSLSEVAPVVI